MLMGHHRQLCPLRPRASAVLPIELGRMEHIMDEKTSSAPMQEDPQKGEELSFTITGEDAEARHPLINFTKADAEPSVVLNRGE